MCRAAWPPSTSPWRRFPHRQTLCRRPVLPRGLRLPTPPIGQPGISSCALCTSLLCRDPRNGGSILLCEGSVCAPWHKTPQSTEKAPNFLGLRKGEVPRTPIPRSTVHTVGSNRPRYRREEACPRETSACSQTYDAENTTTPLKRRYGKGYLT